MSKHSSSQSPESLKFIDLFAGIGGIRLAFQRSGCECVFSSEWDTHAQTTYEANFGDRPEGDIRLIQSKDIPNHDILAAGFPCQPFSLSGVSKKNSLGLKHGFEDPTQGTLFFEIVRILKHKRPKAFLLENVKNLKSHDSGNTFKVILHNLINELGYDVYHNVVDADSLVPQHRERTYIVGFREKTAYKFPVIQKKQKPKFRSILDPKVDKKYILTDKLWEYLQGYAKKHRELGNGFGFGMTDLNGRARTLSARYYKDGSEILIPRGKGRNPRRLTPRECARLMGFPNNFKIPVSDTQAYKQFGNSVVVPVVQIIARSIVERLKDQPTGTNKRNSFIVPERQGMRDGVLQTA